MCFFYALSQTAQRLKNRYQLKFDFTFEFAPVYYTSGFEYPKMPVLTSEKPEMLQEFQWGLVPFWIKSLEEAQKIKSQTLNARSETVSSKPSFRHAVKQNRCLVPADGFYEWREIGGKKYPYFIYLKDKDIFSFAGIWDQWIDLTTGELLHSFSILTTNANPLLEKIHNTKKRMPVILPKDMEMNWLRKDLSTAEMQNLMQPLDANLMEAHPVSRLITSKSEPRNVPAIQLPFQYKELIDP